MKKTIGFAVLMLTAAAAFAQPAAAAEARYIVAGGCQQPVVVVQHDNRWRAHRVVEVRNTRIIRNDRDRR
jgi:CTP:molybdopterin cytidylyltransferase MocA